jgi:hypothetical protein
MWFCQNVKIVEKMQKEIEKYQIFKFTAEDMEDMRNKLIEEVRQMPLLVSSLKLQFSTNEKSRRYLFSSILKRNIQSLS